MTNIKRILSLLSCVLLLAMMVVPVSANETSADGNVPATDPYAVIAETQAEGDTGLTPSYELPYEDFQEPFAITEELTGSIFNFDLNFNDATSPMVYYKQYFAIEELPVLREGLAGSISEIFGTYTPRTIMIDTIIDGVVIETTEQIVPGIAGIDFDWLAGVFLFSVLFYCAMRLLGGVLS